MQHFRNAADAGYVTTSASDSLRPNLHHNPWLVAIRHSDAKICQPATVSENQQLWVTDKLGLTQLIRQLLCLQHHWTQQRNVTYYKACTATERQANAGQYNLPYRHNNVKSLTRIVQSSHAEYLRQKTVLRHSKQQAIKRTIFSQLNQQF